MMSGVHFEEIEENVAQSEIVDSINFALDSVLLWLQRARGSQVVVFSYTKFKTFQCTMYMYIVHILIGI